MDIKALTEYQLKLNGIDFSPVAHSTLTSMMLADQVVKTNQLGNNTKLTELIHEANAPLMEFVNYIDGLKDQVWHTIDANDHLMYSRSTELYRETLLYPADYVLGREEQNLIYHNVWDAFCERVKLYVNWQHPALELRPGTGRLTRQLVGCDPLYIVDTSDQLLQKAKDRFTAEYKHRLRCYTVNEVNESILGELPQGQFGLVVAHDFFQYHPIELVERYIKEVFELLRPGGHFVFAFNDCDLPNGVDLATRMFYCYTPGRKIVKLLEQYGYEIIKKYNLNLNTAWIEARRPGTLSSIRGSQTLGTVVNI